MSESSNIAKLRALVDAAEDDSFGVVLNANVLLDAACKTVDATCIKIEPHYFPLYKRHGYIFTFDVFEPEKYSEIDLELFVRFDPRWKSIPRSSKLYKLLCVALGRHPRKGERLGKETFLRQAFRCAVTMVATGPAAYSKIESLVERLTGKYSR